MTRRLIGAALALAVVGMCGTAFAEVTVGMATDCGEGLVLKKFGSVGTGGTGAQSANQISTAGADIWAVSWACTGSACSFGLYDGDLPSAVGTIQFEGAGVASGGGFHQLSRPITFSNGISVGGSNLSGVIVYACQQR